MGTSTQFEVDGRQFKAERLSAIDQFHLSRKVAPLLPSLAPLFIKMAEEVAKAPGGRINIDSELLPLIALAEPFAEAIADLKDSTAEQLFVMTLSSVKVETSPGTWMPLWIAGARQAAVIELNDLGGLLPIVLRVIQFNLGPFIAGFLTSRGEPSPVSSGSLSPTA